MKTNRFVALIRGINVGGHNKLPMAMLRDVIGEAGGCEVETYIQSGNAVFSHRGDDPARIAADVYAGIARSAGFETPVLVIRAARLTEAIAEMPFPTEDPKATHLFFRYGPIDPNVLEEAQARLTGREVLKVSKDVVYAYAPDGIARSKAVELLSRKLNATARNWRTACAIKELI